MDDHETIVDLERWSQGCSVLLDPPAGWEPNPQVARARFEARLHRRHRRTRFWLAAVTAGVLACVAVATIRPPSALAQKTGGGTANGMYRVKQLWHWAFYVRPGPVLLPSLAAEVKLLKSQPLTQPVAPQLVFNVEEAARLGGFVPQLPHSDVLQHSPRISVHSSMSFRAVVSTADLDRLLRERDVLDENVPMRWEGARIDLKMGATIAAEWTDVPDESSGEIEWSKLTLTQGPPPVIGRPAGFDLAAFTEANLRAAGMRNRKAASQLSGLNTTLPALLLASQTQRWVAVRPVNFYSFSLGYTRPATLIEEFGSVHDDSGPPVERMTLIWSVPEREPKRMFVLSGTMRHPSDMMSLAMAGALTNLMDVATSIY
jgi:hypothetical protein